MIIWEIRLLGLRWSLGIDIYMGMLFVADDTGVLFFLGDRLGEPGSGLDRRLFLPEMCDIL